MDDETDMLPVNNRNDVGIHLIVVLITGELKV